VRWIDEPMEHNFFRVQRWRCLLSASGEVQSQRAQEQTNGARFVRRVTEENWVTIMWLFAILNLPLVYLFPNIPWLKTGADSRRTLLPLCAKEAIRVHGGETSSLYPAYW